jgi:hypothetical protein
MAIDLLQKEFGFFVVGSVQRPVVVARFVREFESLPSPGEQ